MSKVWEMPEYQMSTDEYKQWATNKGYPNFTGKEILDKLGVSKPKVKVKTNTGEEVEVDLDVRNSWNVRLNLPSQYTKVDGKYKTVYMVKGSSPKNKTAVFITDEDVRESPDFKEFSKKMSAAMKEVQDEYFSGLQLELRKNLSPAAKKAISDNVLKFIEDKDFKKLHDWFVAQKFADVPDPKELESMSKLSGYIKTSRPDGWGHTTGSAIQIDWKNKKFSEHGWSSDD